MGGMSTGLDAGNPVLVAAFRSALVHQLAVVAGVAAVLLVGYLAACRWLTGCWPASLAGRWPAGRSLAGRSRATAAAAGGAPVPAEARARRMLRLGFGLLWLLDGILQAQPKMAGGLASQVIAPAAADSPRWVQDVVNPGITIWSYHPVQAGAAAVWIQAGLGLWLIVAGGGWWSRLAGLASLTWGLIVWVLGEAFGEIFAPGLSLLTGTPGAALLYVLAGALITLPARAWASRRLGRLLLAGIGAFWLAMAVLQAWPGRESSALAEEVSSMAGLPQPRGQAAIVSAFASLAAAHPVAVSATAAAVIAACGLALLAGWPPALRVAVPAAVIFCLADWVLVQDLGIPGGLGTDPESMPAWVLLLACGYLAVTAPSQAPPALASSPAAFGLRAVAALRHAVATSGARLLAGAAAVAIMAIGAGPMAAASMNGNADPVVARALAGGSVRLDRPAPALALISQSGRPVTLASLRGKVVLLTFLDPVCGQCSVIADDMRAAGELLGADDQRVELVAVAADALHSGPVFISAFDHGTGMDSVPNWLFLTGTSASLQRAWNGYEAVAPGMMTGMNPHSDVAFVIDATGHIREIIKDDPGPGTSSIRSSFAVLLSQAVRRALG